MGTELCLLSFSPAAKHNKNPAVKVPEILQKILLRGGSYG
jgi:hypothetical protein